MEWILALLLAGFLVYLIWDEVQSTPAVPRGRLCDSIAYGSVYEDVSTACKRGVRLIELHVYSDEQDWPVVATGPLHDGYDYSKDNVSFESCMVDLVNDAFPSKDPMILSIVPHTFKSVTLNRIAEILETTVRKHMVPDKNLATAPLDELANKLLLVTGGVIQGTRLEALSNFNWSESTTRRLSYQQALSPRDPQELKRFTRDSIVIVGPEMELKTINENPRRPALAFGCQWNVYGTGTPGFTEKTFLRKE
jgi:hypothetical protein